MSDIFPRCFVSLNLPWLRRGRTTEQASEKLSSLFWGYPELVEEYGKTIIPAIHARAHERVRAHREQERQRYKKSLEAEAKKGRDQEAQATASDNSPSSSTSSPEAGNTAPPPASSSTHAVVQPSLGSDEDQAKPPRQEGEIVEVEVF